MQDFKEGMKVEVCDRENPDFGKLGTVTHVAPNDSIHKIAVRLDGRVLWKAFRPDELRESFSMSVNLTMHEKITAILLSEGRAKLEGDTLLLPSTSVIERYCELLVSLKTK